MLGSKGTRFLTGDTMCCFDCELMPKLQHIRVAGERRDLYWEGECEEYHHVWWVKWLEREAAKAQPLSLTLVWLSSLAKTVTTALFLLFCKKSQYKLQHVAPDLFVFVQEIL